MHDFRAFSASLLLLIASVRIATTAEPTSPPPDDDSKAVGSSTVRAAEQQAEAGADAELPWLSELAAGYLDAQRQGRPIFVRAGGDWCPHCGVLAEQIKQSEVQAELRRWTLVYIDVDVSVDDARSLGVGPIPTLRLLTSGGKVVVAHDGAMDAADLVAWLQSNYDKAAVKPSDELVSSGPPTTLAVVRLIRDFGQRDATLREGAVRRLMPYPQIAAGPISEAFANGSLATRLAGLELLDAWKAPVQDLDPWQPQTMTAERLKVLTDWAAEAAQKPDGELLQRELTAEDLAEAKAAIDRMVRGTPAEADAIRERLAQHRQALLPAVYERLKIAETDLERERLTALRYRLLASDELALTWAGGLHRLAATDLATRKRAADELAARATSSDEGLLLELFTDPAPLVREIALNALQSVGGDDLSDAMLRLLKDPEPNVRAAVLRQLAESPSHQIVPQVAEYVTGEPDSDLVVHAVRFLRAAKGTEALDALKGLLTHSDWRVRAETAEAVGEIASQDSELDQAIKAGAYQSLVQRLDDEDGFVVSRAVKSLSDADLVSVVEPLVNTIARHPELAKEIIEALISGQNQRVAAIPYLRDLCKSDDPRVRAASLKGLCEVAGDEVDEELAAGLKDEQSLVRIAAAESLLKIAVDKDNRASTLLAEEAVAVSSLEGGLFSRFLKALQPDVSSETPQPVKEEVTTKKDEADDLQEAQREAADDIADSKADSALDEVNPTERPAENSQEQPELNDTADVSEDYLKRIREGEVFEEWMYELAALLEPMLAAQVDDERLAAALSLAALGRDASALPALNSLLDQQPRQAPKIAPVLRWLRRDDRRKLFDRLVASHTDKDQLAQITSEMAAARDLQASDALWSLLSHEKADARLAEAVCLALKELYFAEQSYSPEDARARQRRRATADATPRAEAGPAWQRIAALSILMKIDETICEEIAQTIATDPAMAPPIRASALKILLASQSEVKGLHTAVDFLSSENQEVRKIALSFLTVGKSALDSSGGDTFSLTGSHTAFSAIETPFHARFSGDSRDSQLILPEPPEGITVDVLLPLSQSADPEEAAYAAYLLVLLDQPGAVDKLVKHWENVDPKEEQWRRLMYRAVVYLDDPAYLPVLERIYKSFSKSDDGLKEFYWTLRSMTIPDALALRKRIREEAGMERLQ